MAEPTQDPVDQFCRDLLKTAKLDSLPEDVREAALEKLRVQVQRRLGLLALEHLDEAGVTAFQEFIAKQPPPSPEELQSFLTSRIPNFDQRMQEGLLAFAEEFVTAARSGVPAAS